MNFKLHEKTKNELELRLAFLSKLPKDKAAVRGYILQTQKKDPTDAQIDSWLDWISKECEAIKAEIPLAPTRNTSGEWVVTEKTIEQVKRRLAFLCTLPTEPEKIRAHILQEQKVNPTDEQVESWINWLTDESYALRNKLGGWCEIVDCENQSEPNAKRCQKHYCDGTHCQIRSCPYRRSGLGGVAPSCFCEIHDDQWISYALSLTGDKDDFRTPEERMTRWLASNDWF